MIDPLHISEDTAALTAQDNPLRAQHVQICLHEAAHAVMAELHGQTVTSCEVWCDSEQAGEATRYDHAGRTVWLGRPDSDVYVLIALAGNAAEWLWLRGVTDRLDLPRHWVSIARAHRSSGDAAALHEHLPHSRFTSENEAFDEACELLLPRLLRVGVRAEKVTTSCDCLTDPTLANRDLLVDTPPQRAAEQPPDDQPIPTPSPALVTTAGGTAMSGIDEVRSTLSRATEETEQAQHTLAAAMQLVENARAAVAQVAQSSSRDEIQQVLAQYGHASDSLRELGGRMAASVDQIRTYAAQL